MEAATFTAPDNELPWNSNVGVTPGSGGSTLPRRTFASVFFPAALETSVAVSASLKRVHKGVGDQSGVATSEIGMAGLGGLVMQAPRGAWGGRPTPPPHRAPAAPA